MKLRYLLFALFPAVWLVSQSSPDLQITAITAAVNTDPQTLATTGTLSATFRNNGSAGTATGFQLLAFEDRNNNGRYDAVTDAVLGTANVAAPLAASATTGINIPINGALLFRGNIIHVVIDSNNVILESNETNNTRHTGQSSVFTGPADTALNPIVKWAATSFTELPTSLSTLSSPTVGDVNGDGIPDVVFSTYVTAVRANIRVASGDTGAILFTVTDPNLEVNPAASITLADIDADGRPELITFDAFTRLLVLEHDGTLKWRSTTINPFTWTGPLVADLDRNGTLEIIVGHTVYSAATGARLWVGTGASGHGYAGQGVSVIADLDLDGTLEIVAGPTAYRANGSIYWNKLNTPATLVDGPTAIGNFDSDPNPEILIRCYNNGYVYMLEHDGTVKWAVNHALHQSWGGTPVIGDVDGDGQPEFAIVDRINLIVYETDGSIKWSIPIAEHTSGVTTAVIFDLNNDGRGEIIYADQTKFYILRGTDGTILNQFNHYSTTAGEGPAVADVDKDGHADIVIPADVAGLAEGRGVRVYSGANNNWANTRAVWNQDYFTVTNINDDLTVPAIIRSNWLVPGLNNYRTNGFVPESPVQSNSAADITVSLLRRVDTNFPASTLLIARIGSAGALPAPVNRVEFRNGLGGTLLGAVNTSRVLNPGEYEDVDITWLTPPTGQINLVVTADANNAVNEGDETNNLHATQLIIGQGPYTTVDDLIPRGKDSGADLKWTPIPGAVSYNIYRRTGTGAPSLIRGAYVNTTGAFSDQPLTNNTSYLYEVRWLNAQGQESRQGTESSVQPIPRTQRGDTPPSIMSAPLTRGRTQVAYTYSPTVADPDAGEVLTYALAGAPLGMAFNTSTGRMDWLPSAGQGGSYRLTLTATDSRARSASQSFTLFIETQLVNTPPIILSTAITSGALARLYAYSVRGSDADAADVLTYLLDTAPSGMTIHSATGLIQWTPTAVGTYPVIVRVRDLANAFVTQSFNIIVQNLNRGPQITSTPATSGAAGTAYTYAATATDPDAGDTLSWTLLSAPAGMNVNPATGLVFWNPTTSNVGTHPVTLEVRDIVGATAQQSFAVTISGGTSSNTPPIIHSEPVLTGRINIPYLYDVNALDLEAQPITYSLLTFPAGAVIDANTGLISWTPGPTQTGAHNFTVQARDTQNATATQSFSVNVTSVPPVTFTLISPSVGTDLRVPTPLMGTIADPNPGGPGITWTVRLRQAGAPDRQIGSGAGVLTNATLATIDPTTLANDNYIVRLEIFKGTEGISQDIPYTISGDAKLGQFTTTVRDLTIPLAGIPLTIARNYDSIDTRKGDFGAGWRLATFGSITDAPTESPLQGLRPGHKVYVTLPDGRRISFRFDPFAPAFLFPYVIAPRFTPDAGVFDKLEVAETSVFLFEGVAYADLNNFYNPSRYILTTKDGVRYEIDEAAGVQLIRDRNGATITFTPGAIVSSTGVQLTLTRDGQNRITVIREPGGAELRYSYDAAGNLATATDQQNQVSRYFYENAAFPNHLTRSQDPLGRAMIRNVYDSSGRMIASCPPEGNINTLAGCSQLSHSPGALTQTVYNARGFRRDYTYDDRGNLLTERRYIDATSFRDTVRTYDSANNLLTERDAAGNVTSYSYDIAGNMLSRTDSGGRRITIAYNPLCNRAATITDAAGGVTSFTYDAFCDLIFVWDRAGRTTEYRYDAEGNQTHVIDARGATTIRTYTAQGYPQTIRDPRGGVMLLTWSTTGDLLSKTDRNGRRIDYTYDTAHHLVRETWADGRVIQFTRDAYGKLLSASDASATIAFQFDGLGRRTRSEATYPGQALFAIDYAYDANGNRTAVADSMGGSTAGSYNGLDQLVSLTQSGAGVSSKRVDFAYDLAGLPLTVRRFADLAGTVAVANTGIEYECGGCAGRLSAMRHTNGANTIGFQMLTFGRNLLGDITQATDSEGLHLFEYDAAQQLTRAAHPNAANQPLETYAYDLAGNRTSSHLSATYTYSYQGGPGGNLLTSDVLYDYTYDAEGNLTQSRNRVDGSTVAYQYDFRNRVTAIIARNSLSVETGRTTFAYDAADRRILSTDAGGDTRYFYDLLNPILAIGPGSTVTRRFYGEGLDSILAEETGGQTRWLLTDNVGTVRTVVDNTATVVSQLLLDSFGRPLRNSNPTVTSELGFAGRESIALSGDQYFRARLYSPRLGRFLQADPLEPYGYVYASNSPLVRIDPLGLADAPENASLWSRVTTQLSKAGSALKAGKNTACLLAGLGFALAGAATGNEAMLDGAGAFALTAGRKLEETACEE
ncbi:MAG: putative Ig domain-containing protein [Bryobacteraceae bacterium]